MYNYYFAAVNIIFLVVLLACVLIVVFNKKIINCIFALSVIGIILSMEFLFLRMSILAVIQIIIGGLVIPALFLKVYNYIYIENRKENKNEDLKEEKE